MSQRLTLPFHPYLSDPLTGAPLRALGYCIRDGKSVPFFPAIGAADDDTGNSGGDDDGADNDDQQTDDDADTDDTGDDDKGTETVAKSELDKVTERMKAADRRASAAEAKVKEFEKAGQTEAEKLQSERDEAKASADSAAEALKTVRIENAILSLKNAPTWHDPEEAVAILRRSYMDGVEIGDDGKVTGVEAAVKKLAKDKPYLVNNQTGTSSTADQMNGKRKGDKGDVTAKTAELKSRFPSLANK